MRAGSFILEGLAIGLLLFLASALCEAKKPEQTAEVPGRDRLLVVSREVMQSAGYCALITRDDRGQPQARAMDPFAPEEDFVVWLATNPESRKVRQIRNDPRVALYYFDSETYSYVTLLGKATLVDDPTEKARRWKEGWEAFYPDRAGSYLLIRVVPGKLEVVSVAHGISGDPETWTPLSAGFEGVESTD